MTATNHALTGATIGLLVGNPLIALPAALLSHFVCDSIPHFGSSKNKFWIKTKAFRNILLVDMLACIVLVSIIAGMHPTHWFLACICAFLATSPDLIWINVFMKIRHNKKWHPSLFSKFAQRIQWFEKPLGAVVEVTWLLSGVFVLSILVH